MKRRIDRISALTFCELFELFLHQSHFLLELLLLFFLNVIFSKHIKINLWYPLVFAVEFVQLFDRIRVGLRCIRVVSERICFTMDLVGTFLALFAVS